MENASIFLKKACGKIKTHMPIVKLYLLNISINTWYSSVTASSQPYNSVTLLLLSTLEIILNIVYDENLIVSTLQYVLTISVNELVM